MTKTISTAVLVLTLGTYAHANQYTPHTYTNAISAHNISSFQHTITQAAFNGFGLQNQNTFNKKQSTAIINTPDLYGHAPMYGTELMYGEFNEDGTMGRSGGDTQFAALSNIWLNWQHTNSDIKFNNIAPISNKNDLIMAGLSGKQSIPDANAAWRRFLPGIPSGSHLARGQHGIHSPKHGAGAPGSRGCSPAAAQKRPVWR